MHVERAIPKQLSSPAGRTRTRGAHTLHAQRPSVHTRVSEHGARPPGHTQGTENLHTSSPEGAHAPKLGLPSAPAPPAAMAPKRGLEAQALPLCHGGIFCENPPVLGHTALSLPKPSREIGVG